MAVDVQRYGARDDFRQYTAQQELAGLLIHAAQRADLDRASWALQPAGDGELAVLPPDSDGTAAAALIDDYTRELAVGLRRLNMDRLDDRHLRLRVAIHHGVVLPGAFGYSGQGPVQVNRLLDSRELRQLLGPPVDLVVMLSDRLYRDVVQQGHTSLEVEQFVHVEVAAKEFREPAHVYSPGRRPPWILGDDQEVSAAGLRTLFMELFATSPPAEDEREYLVLSRQLEALGYPNIGDVRSAILRKYDEALSYARTHPPLTAEAGERTGLGMARLTLALADPRFSPTAHGIDWP